MKTITDHILDIVQNSVRAGATLIEIIFEEDKKNDLCSLIIKDNGCGMDEETVNRAIDPFFTSRETRKVGLGLSLLKQNAEQANGRFHLRSKPGEGTELKAVFQLSHFDRQPLGDIWEAYYLTMLGNQKTDLVYHHKTERGEFRISSNEIREMLGDVSLQQKEIKGAITDLIKNNLIELNAIK